MADPDKPLLKKELGLLSVYALATGATLSSGFFLLPGLAFTQAGPAVILSYMLAAIPLIPAMFSIVELGSAMPRSGGVYYFLDRTLGPLVGTIGGFGTWLALTLKTAFALIGMGAYINIYLPQFEIVPAAIVFSVIFAIVNLFGTKKTGSLQIGLVVALLVILVGFLAHGLPSIRPEYFESFLSEGWEAIIGTSGLVYISYVGVTKVASVSEEIKNPERNLPLGVFLAVATALIIYGLGTIVMVGVVPAGQLNGDLAPVATAATIIAGSWGKALATIAALCAFFAVANAGILSASRYPLAMSRDHLVPPFFKKLNSRGIPANGVYVTFATLVVIVILFDPTKIAKLASSVQLLVFSLVCLSVILMRESGLESYDPGYRSPGYPWLHICGILIPVWLLFQMGILPILFGLGLLGLGSLWYLKYARSRVDRRGAILHVFERLGQGRHVGLDRELRGIMKEKGLRQEDPYDEVVARANVIDLENEVSFEDVTRQAASILSRQVGVGEDKLVEGFLEGTRVGATPVDRGVALPHMRLHELTFPMMIVVRSRAGIRIEVENPIDENYSPDELNHAIFFLVSPEANPAQHLRVLAQLASHIDETDFMSNWVAARNEQHLKEILLRDERYLTLALHREKKTGALIGLALKDVPLPEDCLVALIRRVDRSLVPHGNSVLQAGDRLTLIGDPEGIRKLYEEYVRSPDHQSDGEP